MSSREIDVTVVFALPERTTEIAVRLPAGATLGEALERSGLAARHPDANTMSSPVGVFGKRADRHRLLADGDRIEVYRSLAAAPTELRSARAAAAGKAREN